MGYEALGSIVVAPKLFTVFGEKYGFQTIAEVFYDEEGKDYTLSKDYLESKKDVASEYPGGRPSIRFMYKKV